MSTFIKRLLIIFAVFGVGIGIIYVVTPFSSLNIEISSWGWAFMIGGGILSIVARSYLAGFFKGALKDVAFAQNAAVREYADEIGNWVMIAAVFLIGTSVMPQYLSCSSAVGVVAFSVFYGFLFGTSDLLCERFAPRTPKN